MRARKSIELHGSINPFQSLLRNAFSGHGWAMQTVQDYPALTAQLEEKVANLKRERDSVLRDVESLSQKVALKELERQARSLEGELDGLKGKRSVLEQKLATFDASQAQTAPPQQRPPVRPVGQ